MSELITTPTPVNHASEIARLKAVSASALAEIKIHERDLALAHVPAELAATVTERMRAGLSQEHAIEAILSQHERNQAQTK